MHGTATCNSSSKGPAVLFWPVQAPGTHVVYSHVQAKYSYTFKIFKLLRKQSEGMSGQDDGHTNAQTGGQNM